MAFIIALAICIAFFIGSWMWIMPTMQEKQLGSLRQRASMAGFRVKFITLDAYQKLFGKAALSQQTLPAKQIVRYSKTWAKEPASKLPDCDYQLVLADAQLRTLRVNQQKVAEAQWSTYAVLIRTALELAANMEGLLAVVYQRVENHCDLSLYWQEQGNIEKVDFTDPVFENFLAQVRVLP